MQKSNRKNDRNDAYMLARLARVDPELLSPITHREPSQQHDIAYAMLSYGLGLDETTTVYVMHSSFSARDAAAEKGLALWDRGGLAE